MSEPTHDEQVAQAELVNKFIKEANKKPPSPLKRDLTKCFKLPAGDERNNETLEVLKKYGYEKISLEKLKEIMNPRPEDTTKITPPTSLTDKKDPTKPDADWSLFAGAYKVTSDYHPGPLYRIAIKLDGTISWGANGEFSYQAKFENAIKEKDGKTYNEYWAVWGDKEAEWWSVQFFGPSENVSYNTFVGYHYPGNGAKEEKFNGDYIKETNPNDDSDFWLNATKVGAGVIALLLIVGGIYLYCRRRNAQIEDIKKLGEQENKNAQEVQISEKRETKIELDKAVEKLMDDSTAKQEQLVEELEAGVIDIMNKDYADHQQTDPQRRLNDVGEPLRPEIKDAIEAMKTQKIHDIMGTLLTDAKNLATDVNHPEIEGSHIIDGIRNAIEKACTFDPVKLSFDGPLGKIIEQATILRDAPVLKDKLAQVQKATFDFDKAAEKQATDAGHPDIYSSLSPLRVKIDNIRKQWHDAVDAHQKDVYEHQRQMEEAAYKTTVENLKQENQAIVDSVSKTLEKRSEMRMEMQLYNTRIKEDPAKIINDKAAKEKAREAMRMIKP